MKHEQSETLYMNMTKCEDFKSGWKDLIKLAGSECLERKTSSWMHKIGCIKNLKQMTYLKDGIQK